MTYLVLVVIQLLFASLAVVGRLVLPVVPPAALVGLRIFGAALAMTSLQLARGGPWITNRSDLGRIALGGLLGVTANQSLFLFGLKYTTAVSATILVTTVPIFTVAGSVLFRLEPLSRAKLLAIAVAGAGATYLVGPERLSTGHGAAIGDLLILIGMACYSGYFLLSKTLVARYDTITLSTYVMLFAAAGVAPLSVPALLSTPFGGVSPGTWVMVGYIVLFPTIGTYFLNLWALKRASSHTVATFTYLQPLFASLAAPFVLGEVLTPRTVIAGLTIFAGLALLLRAEREPQAGVGVDAILAE